MKLIIITICAICILCLFSSCKDTIILVQFKGINDSITNGIEKNIKNNLNVNIKIIHEDTILDNLKSYSGKYNANKIIFWLSSKLNRNKRDKIIGICDKYLAAESFLGVGEYDVFGYSDNPGKSCIISIYNLNPNNIVSDISVIALHELGHTYGLQHCKNKLCYMYEGEGYPPPTKYYCDSCKLWLKNYKYKNRYVSNI